MTYTSEDHTFTTPTKSGDQKDVPSPEHGDNAHLTGLEQDKKASNPTKPKQGFSLGTQRECETRPQINGFAIFGLPSGENCAKCRVFLKENLTELEMNTIQPVVTVAHTPNSSLENTAGNAPSLDSMSLLMAAKVNEKKARLKEVHQGQLFTVELSMMLIDENAKHHKCQLSPFPDMFAATDPIEAALVQLVKKVETSFLQSQYSHQFPGASYDFSFSSCMLQALSGRKTYSIDKGTFDFKGSLESLFLKLRSSGYLSKTDQDTRKICLQIIVPFSLDSFDDDDPSSTASKPQRKRKHSHVDDGLSQISKPSKPKPNLSSTVCRLFPNGDTEFEELPGDYEIEVPKGWSQYAQGGVPKGGYLLKGFYKYAVSARFEGKQVALFMQKPTMSSSVLNSAALRSELDLLVQGNRFAQSFRERAFAAKAHIPKLEYNVENAFLGMVTLPFQCSYDLPMDDKIVEASVTEASLLFDTFLVVPLLQTKGIYTK
ncbi:hypothetical protein BDP27DRAFT_1370225 [Rhodocollybia butyracea]|uniref:Uncharacterized protein n=1 Tax=Rhodocollybia butyracea TaxID=206335 RepID=A0A9P5TYS3_9AGAR|nr:hypothetical protein BDP27DRAFT_1370225 [Rhodocollybia butyracea]